MNVKKAVKRIGALAAGTSMVAATIMGAAANLGEYPAPFVKDYVFDGKIVVGAKAATSDVLGAIDIAASLQAAAKSPAGDGSGSESISIDGGVAIKGGSEDFNYGDAMNDFNSGEYDSTDFPDILADGVLEDDDGTEWDYEQKITVGDADLAYSQDQDYGDDPVFYLDLSSADPYLVFSVEFDETTDLAALQDSESFMMFGRSYTFDPDNEDDGTGDLTLFGSDVSVQVTQGESVTVEVGGEEYTIDLLGGNSDASPATANIRVTGDGTETKSLAEGSSRTVAGLDLVVEDVFINNIGKSSIAVSLFVGSNELVIPEAAVSTTADTYEQITLNGDDNVDFYAWVDGADLENVDAIHFRVDPTDFDNDATDTNWDWLPMGSTFTESLFGFSLTFDSMTHAYGDGNEVLFARDGDAYDITFTNNGGDEYPALELYVGDGTDVALGENLVLAGNTLVDEDIFILEETESKAGDSTTFIYEVRDIDNTNDEITLRDLSGSTLTIQQDDEIGDAGYYVDDITNTDFDLTLADMSTANNVDTRLVVEGGLIINPDADVTDGGYNDVANLTAVEDSDDVDEAGVGTLTFGIVGDTDDDIAFSAVAWSTGVDGIADEDANYEYGFSDYGTWYREEVDNNGDDLTLYYSGEEADFNVLLTSPEAVAIRSGSNDGNAYMLNEMGVGVAVLDSDAMGLIGRTNLLVVGGPCVNTVAMNLMGNPEACAEGFTMGKGMLKFFSTKKALLVAGYSADDTLGAAYVLADYASYDLAGDEMEVITTDLSDLSVVAVD